MLISCLAAQTDLFSFHEAHFGGAALAAFGTDFFDPDKTKLDADAQHDADEEYYEYYEEEEEDDGLGYYPDGVKRTLTDEQIAMFRHSEILALQKAQEQASDKNQRRRRNSSSPVPMDLVEGSSGEEGELQDDQAAVEQQTLTATKKKKKKKKKRGSGNGNANANKRWEPDPERRKRTWDVVETGLDALDYGEMDRSGASRENVAQRRRVTYDDD